MFRKPEPSPEAAHAAEQAVRIRQDAENLHKRVDHVAHQLSATNERNNFAAAVARAFRGA